ncbi:hypothetical protein [Caballeronia glathei]|jgi:hypothetical protein|uniref:hypothetical protein n=1 Tax=Caballeronia glathei TaxID=60547 RepID=UPI00101A6916|nr:MULTISPECIES: hypothetical protein [Burkholderiaceae]
MENVDPGSAHVITSSNEVPVASAERAHRGATDLLRDSAFRTPMIKKAAARFKSPCIPVRVFDEAFIGLYHTHERGCRALSPTVVNAGPAR